MTLTNDTYLILLKTKSGAEKYFRDKKGWLKVSLRGRKFWATAEQVLNHVLPALAGLEANLSIEVKHREPRARKSARKRTSAKRTRKS